MRLMLGMVNDFTAANTLAQQLLMCGCTANQLVYLTISPLGGAASDTIERDFFYRVTCEDSLTVWSIKDPKLYSGGIRDNRNIETYAKGCLLQVNRNGGHILERYRMSTSGTGKPIVVLQLINLFRMVRPQIRAVFKVAQGTVDIIDVPLGMPNSCNGLLPALQGD